MMEQWNNWLSPLRQRWEEQWMPRYQALEAREQRLVVAAAVILPLALIVFGLLLPLQDRQAELQARLLTAQAQAVEAEQLADYVLAHTAELQPGVQVSGSLLTVVDRLARQHHVRNYMTRIKPHNLPAGGEQLMLRMKDVPYDATLRFMHALAAQHLGLESLKLQPTGNPGYVHVRAVISSH